MGLIHLRAALLVLIAALLAVAAGAVFDEFVPELLVGALVPGVVGVIVVRRNVVVRAVALGVAVVVAVTVVVLVAGGTAGDVVDAFTAGPQRVLSTDWPSPARADLVGTVAAVLAVGTALATGLAGWPRARVSPLLPLVVVFVLVGAASAPAGSLVWWLPPLAVPALAFGALPVGDDAIRGATGPARRAPRRRRLRGGGVLVPAVAAVAAGALVAVPVAFADRADPRRDDPPATVAPVVDPVEATSALRAIDPPIVVHRVSAADGVTELPQRWRVAAIDDYDGQRWTPSLTVRPIGRRLGPDRADAIAVDLEFTTDDLLLVPLPGPPVLVGADVATDDERTLVQLVERPVAGTVVPVTAARLPARTDAVGRAVETRPVDEIAAGFTELATELAGSGTVVDQLTQLETALREDFELDPGAPAGGLQLAFVERFLTDTRRGNEAQFVTAFVLLARSIGADARVAVGFETPDDDTGPAVTLTSDTAILWPEVHVTDVGWVPFDPVPEDVAVDEPTPPRPPAAQVPPAPPPPVAPPSEQATDDEQPDEQPVDESSSVWSSVWRWTLRGAVAAAVIVLPVVIVVATILVLKRRRRRRRLGAATPAERIRGAWAEATDSLVDAGLTIRRSWTDGEIARYGSALAPDARHELQRLAAWSSAATYARRPDPVAGAAAPLGDPDDACAIVEHVDAVLADGRTRWQRWRWQLSLRSLRLATRSPVLGADAHPRPAGGSVRPAAAAG